MVDTYNKFEAVAKVSINNTFTRITKGKTYIITNEDNAYEGEDYQGNWYQLINDDGEVDWFEATKFITLQEARDEKLNEILK
jgi:hypothetical protein